MSFEERGSHGPLMLRLDINGCPASPPVPATALQHARLPPGVRRGLRTSGERGAAPEGEDRKSQHRLLKSEGLKLHHGTCCPVQN